MAEKNPYTSYSKKVAEREKNLQSGLSNVFNLTGETADIAAKTGGPTNLDLYSIPSVAGLASQKAYLESRSKARTKQAKSLTKWLPSYQKSYREYLKWRYPTRYGGGSGSSNVYGGPTEDVNVPIPPLPGLTGMPRQ